MQFVGGLLKQMMGGIIVKQAATRWMLSRAAESTCQGLG
jgi:hypothetical protein